MLINWRVPIIIVSVSKVSRRVSCVSPKLLPLMLARCRAVAHEIENRQVREIEERDRELAERVNTATLEQIKAKVASDMAILKEHVPSKEKDAAEAALDIKYLQERQRILVSAIEIKL